MNIVQGTTGATADQFLQLEQRAKDLGVTTQFSASQAAEGMVFLSQAGLGVVDVFDAIPGSLQLAAAGGLSLARAADIATNVLAGFGLEVAELGRVNDVLAKATISSNTNINKLATALSFAAPVSAGFGVELEETAAAIGILSNAGIQGTRAGTSLVGIMSIIGEKADEIGVAVTDTNGELLPLIQLIDQIAKSGKTTSEIMAIFGRRAGPGMLALLKAGTEGLRVMQEKLEGPNSVGTAAELAEVRLRGFRGALKLLRSAFEGLGIAIGDSGLLDWATNATTAVARFVRQLANLPPVVLRVGTVFGGIIAVIGPLLLGFGAIIRAAGFLEKAWKTLNTTQIPFLKSIPALTRAFVRFIPVIGAIVTALGFLKVAYRTNFLGIGDILDKFFNFSRGIFADITLLFKAVIDSSELLRTSFSLIFGNIVQILQGLGLVIKGAFAAPFLQAVDVVTGAFSIMVDEIRTAINFLGRALSNTASFFSSFGIDVQRGVDQLFGGLSIAGQDAANIFGSAGTAMAKFTAQLAENNEDVARGLEMMSAGSVAFGKNLSEAVTAIRLRLFELRFDQATLNETMEDTGDTTLDLADVFSDLGDTVGDSGTSKDVRTVTDVINEMNAAIADAPILAAALGKQFDENAFLAGELENGIEELIRDFSFDANDATLLPFLKALGEASKDTLEEILRLAEVANEEFIRDIELRIAFDGRPIEDGITDLQSRIDVLMPKLQEALRLDEDTLADSLGNQIESLQSQIDQFNDKVEDDAEAAKEAAKEVAEVIKNEAALRKNAAQAAVNIAAIQRNIAEEKLALEKFIDEQLALLEEARTEKAREEARKRIELATTAGAIRIALAQEELDFQLRIAELREQGDAQREAAANQARAVEAGVANQQLQAALGILAVEREIADERIRIRAILAADAERRRLEEIVQEERALATRLKGLSAFSSLAVTIEKERQEAKERIEKAIDESIEERRRFELEIGELSKQDFLKFLEEKLQGTIRGSSEQIAVLREMFRLEQDIMDDRNGLEENRHRFLVESGDVSLEAHLVWLNNRLEAEEEFSDAWIAIQREILSTEEDIAKREEELLDDRKKKQKEVVDALQKGIQIAQGFADGLNQIGKDGNDTAEGLVKLAAGIGEVVGLIAGIPGLGQTIQAVGTLVLSVLGDMSNGIEATRKKIEGLQKGFKFIDAAILVVRERVSRGGILGLVGLTKELAVINELAQAIATRLEGGVVSGLTAGMTNFLNTGDFLGFLKDIRAGIRSAITNAIVESVIQGAIIKGALGKLLTELTEALAAGTDPSSIIAEIGAAIPGLTNELVNVLNPLKDALDASTGAVSDAAGQAADAAEDLTNVPPITLVPVGGNTLNRNTAPVAVPSLTPLGLPPAGGLASVSSSAVGANLLGSGNPQMTGAGGLNSSIRDLTARLNRIDDIIPIQINNPVIREEADIVKLKEAIAQDLRDRRRGL